MKKILFVEDEALVARIYTQKLAEAGFEVLIAEDGLAAMKLLPEFNPDLVVLDLLMPKLTGLDVVKFMREHAATKATPVIVFSNSFINKVGEQISSFGVEEMLAKGAVTPDLLIQRVSRILDRASVVLTAPTPPPPPSGPPPAPIAPTAPLAKPPMSGRSPSIKDLDPTYRNENAASFRKRIRRDFFDQIPVISKGVEQASQEFLDAPDAPARALKLEALSRKLGFVTHMTGMAACYRIAQLSSALEALLFELREKPALFNESSRNTIATTVGLLSDWLARADQPDDQCLSPTTILLVDDDAVSNRALVFALSRVNLVTKSVTDPIKALEKLRANSYDAVLMDINLPGMSGLTVCEQMRDLPLHKHTPVIFITSHAEFEPRARAISSVNDDFISKPILPIELTVKVTAHVLKRRLAEQTAGR